MTLEAQRTALVSMPVPKPTLSQVIIEKIREGATLEETKQYYAFLREIQRDEARVQFDADFVVMQGELPEVPKLGRIDHGGGRGYNYARWEDINDRIKPVLQKYGFGLTLISSPKPKPVGDRGHPRPPQRLFDLHVRKKLPIDKSGAKNIVQAYGSTQSYAQRYSAIALLNLTSRNEDNDANGKGYKPPEKLSDEALSDLAKAITDSGRTEEWFCQFAHISELEDLAPERFAAALAYVKKLPKVDDRSERIAAPVAKGRPSGAVGSVKESQTSESAANTASGGQEAHLKQGTDEWTLARVGSVGASRVHDIVAITRSGGFTAGRKNYMAELVCERLTGQPAPTYPIRSHALRHRVRARSPLCLCARQGRRDRRSGNYIVTRQSKGRTRRQMA